ncbi:MAG: class I SAM-dependent methyltransferase, partial [Myxococcota bacterium]
MRFWPSLTAEAVCLARALERHHPQSALDDPYAAQFLRRGTRLASHRVVASALDPHGLLASIGLRHAWLDNRIREAIPQVQALLVLGAGYDSRSWRLPLDGRIAVKIDHPATQRRKRRKVEAL